VCIVQVKKNELLPMFRGIVRECRDHISHCEVSMLAVLVYSCETVIILTVTKNTRYVQ